jgi:hypothetical protein
MPVESKGGRVVCVSVLVLAAKGPVPVKQRCDQDECHRGGGRTQCQHLRVQSA